MDVQRSLRTVIATGSVVIGADQTQKKIDAGAARLVVLANNCPHGDAIRAAAGSKNVPVYAFNGMGTDLGPACGKPFAISALAVLDPGQSEVLQLAKA